ncbi:olfactory receptor 2D3-like [Microtus ochrogaster]|uniref:Olfactory receptor 2D3-like n=1 Tax=Microtus ochrogaster TaxID=79684 RepID=A0ABM1AKW0_MICOH|nr:olfactory receptor 2D3-like [Microtus ochrogaster]
MIPGQNQSWVSEFILLGFSSDPTTNSILFIVFLLIYLSSVMGNGLIILLICLDSHLHTPMYFFLCILAIVFVVVTPISLIVASYVHIAMAILKIKSTQARFKAFSTCASHLTVVTLFYGPASYIYMRPNSSYSPERDKQISLFYNAFTALLNPVVYSLRNKDIKRAFLKVIGHNRVD